MNARPPAEQFAITFVKCETCRAHEDEACFGVHHQRLTYGVYVSRRLAARKLRREDPELYQRFKRDLVARKNA